MADDEQEDTHMLTMIEWNKLKDDTRNAALDVHMARLRFLASASVVVDGKPEMPETVTHGQNRKALALARAAYAEKIAEYQSAILETDLDISIVDGELLAPEHEDLTAPHEHEVVDPVPPSTETPPAPTSDAPSA